MKKMKTLCIYTIVATLSLLISTSCHRNESKQSKISLINDISNNNSEKKNDIAIVSESVFLFKNDTLIQTVEVKFMNDEKIDFKLSSENILRNKVEKIEGTAENYNLAVGSSETDMNDDGEIYPVNEYIYEGSCWLSFKIDVATKTKMRIYVADCILNPYCPFASIGILNKVHQ